MANPWDSDPVTSPLDVALTLEGVTGKRADLARSIYQQESSSGANTATSDAGAVGGMQVIPSTFNLVADKGWNINNPVDNARAGVRYVGRMMDASGDDPRLAAIGYYGGPGAITKAKSGVAVSDPRNPNAPNTLQYANQIVARLGNAVADAVIPAAQADTLTDQPWLQDAVVGDTKPQGSNAPLAEGHWTADGGYSVTIRPGNAQPTDNAPWLKDELVHQQQPMQQPSFVDRVGRQVGLTARYGAEGLGQVADVFTEPLRRLIVNPVAHALDLPEGGSTSGLASRGADAVGLPQPQGAQENIVGDATRLAAGAGGLAGVSSALARGASGVIQAGLRELAANPIQQLASATGAGASGGVAKQLFPGNVTVQMLGEALGGLGAGSTIAGMSSRSARQAAEAAVPTVSSLRARAGDLYDDAEHLGVTATQQQTQELAQGMRSIAQQEGLVSPTGRVSEAYPKAREALRMLDDYGQGTMNVPQMQTVRKVLSDAAGSTDSAERRIASIMLNRFDDFTAPLAPQLGDARMLYARALRGEQLETLRDLAASRAGQFTGSGYENALRTEYRGLDRRIAKGVERGWTPEQQDAISRVARGTAYANALRNVGKAAPTGIVSYGLSTGVPFMIGNALGGPTLGATLSGATMGTGFLARELATRVTQKNALLAEMLARNGGTLPASPRRNLWPAMLGAALSGQATVDH